MTDGSVERCQLLVITLIPGPGNLDHFRGSASQPQSIGSAESDLWHGPLRTPLTGQYKKPEDTPMLGLFKTSPVKKLQKQQDVLLTRAFEAQRNGNIRLYSALTSEAESLREKIEQLMKGS
jgi:hypothetical protein